MASSFCTYRLFDVYSFAYSFYNAVERLVGRELAEKIATGSAVFVELDELGG